MSQDELVPLKRVLGVLGVSRATLWRARKVAPRFPQPRVIEGRVFWHGSELEKLTVSIARFGGRRAFEKERRLIALRAERDKSRRMGRVRRAATWSRENNLFGWARDQAD